MKPKIGVVFPKITDKDIADLEIEKIRVSKNSLRISQAVSRMMRSGRREM